MVEEYRRNFKSFWDMVEALGGSPGIHEGMIDALMKDPTKVAGMTRPTHNKIMKIKMRQTRQSRQH
jgi:hypothetical protein